MIPFFEEDLSFVIRIVLSATLGGIVGWDREISTVPAGIRTYASVCLGACIFGLVSRYAEGAHDPTRIAAQVVSGIGFLGAGVILRDRGQITGLTTAAALWATASVGLCIAFEHYFLGVCGATIIFLVLSIHKFNFWNRIKTKGKPPRRLKD